MVSNLAKSKESNTLHDQTVMHCLKDPDFRKYLLIRAIIRDSNDPRTDLIKRDNLDWKIASETEVLVLNGTYLIGYADIVFHIKLKEYDIDETILIEVKSTPNNFFATIRQVKTYAKFLNIHTAIIVTPKATIEQRKEIYHMARSAHTPKLVIYSHVLDTDFSRYTNL